MLNRRGDSGRRLFHLLLRERVLAASGAEAWRLSTPRWPLLGCRPRSRGRWGWRQGRRDGIYVADSGRGLLLSAPRTGHR
jgi:hypothetical protein